ncbi:MAG: methylglutaconyl-CoA hydratase [Mariniblastus sp.]|jgi:methylglutaconyl-CoA hydratase
METFVKSKVESGVGRITLSRPEKRNALKREFIEQLNSSVDSMLADETLRVMIFEAEGAVFCAGMDLGEMQERAQADSGKQEWQRDSEVFAELLLKIFRANVPTIAAMQGPALAGGVGLVLACDFIVANENAFVMLPEPARGITAAMVTPFLVHRIGAGPATQLLLSGQRMSAQRSSELGLVFAIAEPDQLAKSVNSLAESIMTGSKSALAITKTHVQNCSASDLDNLLNQSIGVSAQARETADAREGLAAFLEKRQPNWQA